MLSAESVMLIGVGHKEGRRYGKGNCQGSRLRKRGVPCAARSWYAGATLICQILMDGGNRGRQGKWGQVCSLTNTAPPHRRGLSGPPATTVRADFAKIQVFSHPISFAFPCYRNDHSLRIRKVLKLT